ncbi:hypothetical protein DFH29DRAFT_1008031 [Suillus ampliporus]|nr:hypothetical protein DFH29DRAFT_1008031 [Suillus ampliporus]
MHLYVTTDDLLVGAVTVSSKCSEAPPTEPKPINAVEPAREVTYNVLILPYAEIKKDDIKKWSGTSTILTLHLDEPFDTFKAQILCKINKETSPATLSFDNYKAFFSIIRISPKPTSLSDEDDYKELMKCLMKIKEPIVTIYAQELSDLKKHKDQASDKENGSSDDDSSDEEQRRKRKKKKTQKTKAC